jgi:hypothetical protein
MGFVCIARGNAVTAKSIFISSSSSSRGSNRGSARSRSSRSSSTTTTTTTTEKKKKKKSFDDDCDGDEDEGKGTGRRVLISSAVSFSASMISSSSSFCDNDRNNKNNRDSMFVAYADGLGDQTSVDEAAELSACNGVSNTYKEAFPNLCKYKVTDKVFFDCAIAGESIGRITIGLFGNEVPKLHVTRRRLRALERHRGVLDLRSELPRRIVRNPVHWARLLSNGKRRSEHERLAVLSNDRANALVNWQTRRLR